MSVSEYQAAFRDLVTRMRAEWNVSVVWSHPTFENQDTDSADIAIKNEARVNANVRQVGTSSWIRLAVAPFTDPIHLQSPRDALVIAGYMANDIINFLGYGAGIVAQQAHTLYRGSTPIEAIFIGTRQV